MNHLHTMATIAAPSRPADPPGMPSAPPCGNGCGKLVLGPSMYFCGPFCQRSWYAARCHPDMISWAHRNVWHATDATGHYDQAVGDK